MKILIVDHDQKALAFLYRLMQQGGFQAEMAPSGNIAVEKFQKNPPSAVLLEINLPDMSGLDVLKQMKRINPQIPIIIVTTDAKIASAVKMVKAGAYDYLVKNNLQDLPSVVQTAVEIGDSPELVHDRTQAEGRKPGAKVHREHPRVPFSEEVNIDGRLWGKAINLSMGGIFIHTGRSHPVGTEITCSFRLLDTQVTIQGIVRQAEFSVGIGVEFQNLSPAVIALLRQFIAQTTQAQPQQRAKEPGRWLLFIIDHLSALKMYKSKLILEGYSIAETQSYKKCVELVRQKDIHAVILDLDIKNADMPQVIRTIKNSPVMKALPLLAFSSVHRKELAQSLGEMGVSHYVSRMTTTPKKLVEILNAL